MTPHFSSDGYGFPLNLVWYSASKFEISSDHPTLTFLRQEKVNPLKSASHFCRRIESSGFFVFEWYILILLRVKEFA